MRVPSFFRPPGEPSEATTEQQITALARYVVAPKRERPVVVVTARKGQSAPYFPVHDVQRIVEHHADVVSIRQSEDSGLTAALDRELPVGMAVFNGGARIFWPFKRVARSHESHPIVLADRHPTASPARLQKLETSWASGPDARSEQADPPPSAPSRPRPARSPTPAADADDLRLDVMRAWLELLPEVADRNRFALQSYRVDHHLTEQLELLPEAREPVAAAVARVVSGYAWTEITPVPQRVEHQGAPVLRRHDHAVAWRYPLPSSDFYLYFWQPAGGPIILARFADASLTTLPNVETRKRAVPPTSTTGTVNEPGRPLTPSPPRVAFVSLEPAVSGRRRDSTAFEIADETLIAALRGAGEPVSISRFRELLEVPEATARERVRRVLTDAVDRGVIGRYGVRGGVRYFLP